MSDLQSVPNGAAARSRYVGEAGLGRPIMHHARYGSKAVMSTVTTRPLARRTATALPARSICDKSHPPKMSPCALANTGIAIDRSASSDFDKDLDAFLTAIARHSGPPAQQSPTARCIGLR